MDRLEHGSIADRAPTGTRHRGRVTLRTRTLIAVGGMLIALVVGLSLVSSAMLRGRFRSLDEERARIELHRALATSGEKLASLQAVAKDWAFWDDTYRFASGGQPDYEEQNLSDESLAALSLNLFAVVDAEGRIVFATGFDPAVPARAPLPAGVDSVLRAIAPYPAEARAESVHSGLLPLSGGVMLLARAPLLTSQMNGPAAGSLIVGRWLNPNGEVAAADTVGSVRLSVGRLTEGTSAAARWNELLRVQTPATSNADSTCGRSHALLPTLAERVERDNEAGRVAGEGVTHGFFVDDRLILRTDLPARTSVEGAHAVRVLLYTSLGVGCLFGLLILLLLERQVLFRLHRLHREVTGIAAHGDFSRNLTTTGRDELSSLASSVNDLLSTLGASLRGKEVMLHDLQRAKAEADGLLHAKSRFLSTMSHEIRTPMGAVLGMAGLLLDTELTEEQREHLLILQGGAENLLHILDDILDLSKIEEGKMILDDSPFPLREMVEDVVGLLAWNATKKGLEITAAVDPALPAQVCGDSARVRQILTNLVGNAVKFTAQGEIVVEVARSGEAGREAEYCFTVRDTGIGIAPDRLHAVFDEFMQADQSTTRRFGGTGLGLAISRRLAGLMGGSLTAESAVGQGSTFRLRVPLRALAAPEEVADAVPAAPTMAPLRVLLVDDSDWSRAAVAALVRAGGHAVREAASAGEALNIVESPGAGFHVCIVDRRLPDRDGLELAGELTRRLPAARPVPILMLCRPGEAPRGMDLTLFGVVGILAKPVRRSRLDAELARLGAAGPTEREPICAPPEADVRALDPPVAESPTPESLPHGSPAFEEDLARGSAPVRTAADRAPAPVHVVRRASLAAAAPNLTLPPAGFEVLIVDDNAVNRRVVRRMIEKAGGRVEEADGGEVAVERCGEHAFDLVLMDIQMPGMDGYQATTAIRAGTAGPNAMTPIVALTANALPEDRARCLAAGMNEHLGKPVRTNELNQALATWIRPRKEEPTMDRNTAPPPLQLERLAEVSGGDTEFEKELLAEFLRTAPVLVENAAQAVAAGDTPAALRAAHTLKGASGSIGAGPLAEASRFLEETCKEGRIQEGGPWVAQIRSRFDDLAGFVLGQYGDMAA